MEENTGSEDGDDYDLRMWESVLMSLMCKEVSSQLVMKMIRPSGTEALD